MEVKTYRASTMREALDKVRVDLGPEAAVLHTREIRRPGLVGWLTRGRMIEITASDQVVVPSRLPQRATRPAPAPRPPRGESNWDGEEAMNFTGHHADREVSDVPEQNESSAGRTAPSWGAQAYQPYLNNIEVPHLPGSENATHDESHDDTDTGTDFGSALSHHAAAPLKPFGVQDYRAKFRLDLKGQVDNLHSVVEQLSRPRVKSPQRELPESLFHVFTDLIEADVSEETARDLLDRVRDQLSSSELTHLPTVKERLAQLLEAEILEQAPIRTWRGQRRIVALVGPTGVGKTTTIAKLAANYRLRDKLRVGLITVDTYRIAAVEQLRTYADIIDLPMEVVATPREMREAVARMHDLDLVLMDTAGRSPRDEVKIQELRSLLTEARADEVHLVLSSVGSAANLATTAEKFAPVGTTALILTKLDEATGLGNLLPLLRKSRLPLSYLTNGQNVPDDITVADKRRMARSILGMDL